MSYIKIHEVDKTIQDLAPITSDNIAYIPLNSTDGPIGRYTVLQSYDDFVRVYGSDPNPNSPLLTSWEYAANLLLRKMPVMVRRIGYKIDADGNDTTELLTGAATARGILKLVVPETAETIYSASKAASESTTSDPWAVTLKSDGGAGSQGESDNIEFSYMGMSTPQEFSVTCHSASSDTRKTNVYSLTEDLLSDVPVKVVISPNDEKGIHISDCSVCGSSILFGSQDDNYKLSLNNCEVSDDSGNVLTADQIKQLEAESGIAVIPKGYKLTFTQLTEKNFQLILRGDASIEIYNSATSLNYRKIIFYPELISTPYIADVKFPDSVAIEDPDKMTEFDALGQLNLFKLEYKHPGVNGNRISAGVRLVDRDGIYLQIWNGTQRLENIKLVNARYKNAESGRYAAYTLNADKAIIWKAFLDNFGLVKEDGTVSDVTLQTPLQTDYITVSLNTNINTANADYILCFLNKTGVTRHSLTGGSNPDDSCVIHEVYKTYGMLSDKYLYDVKFVTNGGYCDYIKEGGEDTSTTELIRRNIEYSMINLAESRGDCVAFLDVPLEYPEKDVLDYFEDISSSYATAYAPWTKLNLLTRSTKWCPPSFVALWTIAKSVSRGNKVYAPPAGVNRAHVSEATDLMFQIPSDYIDEWQDNHVQFVNPIVYINGYGINIFGQRTLYSRVDGSYETSSALQYLNTRLVANEIKKKIFKSCIELTFEYNNLHTWLAFKSKMAKLLDVLLYDHSITYYDIVMDESTMSDYDIQTNHIVGTVSVAISTTAEKFDITFELLPNQVNFLNLDYSVDDSTASTTYGQLKTN